MNMLRDKITGRKIAVFDNVWALDVFYRARDFEKESMQWFEYYQENNADVYKNAMKEADGKLYGALDILETVFGIKLNRSHLQDNLFEIV